jgi:hypothetical protein
MIKIAQNPIKWNRVNREKFWRSGDGCSGFNIKIGGKTPGMRTTTRRFQWLADVPNVLI